MDDAANDAALIPTADPGPTLAQLTAWLGTEIRGLRATLDRVGGSEREVRASADQMHNTSNFLLRTAAAHGMLRPFVEAMAQQLREAQFAAAANTLGDWLSGRLDLSGALSFTAELMRPSGAATEAISHRATTGEQHE